jgi:hypothetical protein
MGYISLDLMMIIWEMYARIVNQVSKFGKYGQPISVNTRSINLPTLSWHFDYYGSPIPGPG